MPLNIFYTMVQKVKNDQKLKSRGGGTTRYASLLSACESNGFAQVI